MPLEQRRLARGARRSLARFRRREDGAMIIFCVMVFGLMLAIGGLSFDLMRYEMHRDRLQTTLDRAVLAAASIGQQNDPKAVVLDYFEKAGMSQYIDENDITVTPGFGSRRVEAVAHIHVPLHHGAFAAFSGDDNPDENTLIATARSAASEGIGDVEISMVLDVSWSMNDNDTHNGQSRLENLKDAAQGFLNTVYGNSSEAGTVSTSIVPYSTQVAATQELMSYFERTDTHENSHCLNFAETDFDYVGLSPNTGGGSPTSYEQALHFDPWTNEWDYWDVGDGMWAPNCPTDASLLIMPWETSLTTLTNYIEAFQPQYNTSTDLGAKWGAAMLDPSMQTVVTGMVGSNTLDPAVGGRPFNYEDGASMKVLVFMTDGDNTSQWRMEDEYRNLDSFVWRYMQPNGSFRYSIWHDGAGSEPTPVYQTETETLYEWQWVKVWYKDWYCDEYDWWPGYGSYCVDWDYEWDYYWDEQQVAVGEIEVGVENWFTVYRNNGSTQYRWEYTPYDGDNVWTDDGVTDTMQAERMTWAEVWEEFPPEVFSDDILYEMGTLTDNERNVYEYAVKSVNQATKDARFLSICQEAKDEDIIVFTVGLEVSDHSDVLLDTCATSTSHYYDAETLDIGQAFQSIAIEINQLRLTQ